MQCAKCGAQNPIVAKACHKCGSHSICRTRVKPQDKPKGPPLPKAIPLKQLDKLLPTTIGLWSATGCMTLVGVFILFAGLADLWAGRDTVPRAIFPISNPIIWMISAVVLGLLLTGTGIAILTRNAKNHSSGR